MSAPKQNEASASRQIVRASRKAALATLDGETGAPFASLVAVATGFDATPVTLMSTLARHTKNIDRDPRASLLFEQVEPAPEGGDILAAGRVTVMGRLERSDDAELRRRFLARHPESAHYASFADFSFYALRVESAHFVGGFGRIETMPAATFLFAGAKAARLAGAEADVIAHMNEDHHEAVGLYATRLLGAAKGAWQFVGFDPEGADLLCEGAQRRLVFPDPVYDADALRKMLVQLADDARRRAL
ncbi:MAG: pyridoxamine 5'-phosphate oxidase family protein [Hyphomicrobiales bacterium]|nr:pyridoxamine 5'-phosphate oxidase family protein [Hyphomicrobiales bacterium]